jgi:carbonic anhydrase/acetyltransferase-like protein (isoleucine patch superfamily)
MPQPALILPYRGVTPKLAPSVYLAETAVITGDVEIGEESSVWFGAVIRGDASRIRIGRRTNLQDLSMLHGLTDRFDVVIGDEVTAGHRVTLHGCHIGSRCLIGMGSIVLDGARIGDEVFIAAGSLVPPGMEIPGGVMVMGSPAKVKRALTAEERAQILSAAQSYVDTSREYLSAARAKAAE